jgi:hypothetical protein
MNFGVDGGATWDSDDSDLDVGWVDEAQGYRRRKPLQRYPKPARIRSWRFGSTTSAARTSPRG